MSDHRRPTLEVILGSLGWQDDTDVTPLTGGLTNHAFLLRRRDGLFTLRVFGDGSEHFTSREDEARCHATYSSLGLAPALVHLDDNRSYMITEFVEGRLLDPGAYVTDEFFPLIAASMRHLHQSNLAINRLFEPELKARQLMATVLERATTIVSASHITNLFNGVVRLLQRIAREPLAYYPCHLDLVPANVVVTSAPRDRRKVVFIDWEYAAMAPLELEFANIFTELESDGDDERRLLAMYFQSDEGIDGFHERTRGFRCFTSFYWFLWCQLQASQSQLRRDYESHASKYFDLANEGLRGL